MESITAKLLSYNTKDRNYTLISLCIYLLFFGLIFWFIFSSEAGIKIFTKVLTGDKDGKLPTAFSYINYIYAVFIPLFIAYKLYVFANRKSKINELCSRVESHQLITHFNTNIDYKLIIPLRIFKLQLLPIQYAMIQFADKKIFHLPMPNEAIQPIKSISSGATTTSVESTWKNLERDGNNTLSDKQKYLIGCSLILTTINDENAHQIAAGDAASSKEKLEKWWSIFSKSDLLKTINRLKSNDGHRYEFAKENARNETTKCISQIAPLAQKIGIQTPNEIAAWDYCRAVSLCRWAVDVNYFSEYEAEAEMMEMAKALQATYSNWHTMAIAYLLGRAWWGGEENIMKDEGFTTTYEGVLQNIKDKKSYWNTIDFKTNLS